MAVEDADIVFHILNINNLFKLRIETTLKYLQINKHTKNLFKKKTLKVFSVPFLVFTVLKIQLQKSLHINSIVFGDNYVKFKFSNLIIIINCML